MAEPDASGRRCPPDPGARRLFNRHIRYIEGYGDQEHCHHRPRRSWQNDPRRQDAQAGRRVPREPGRAGTRHGLEPAERERGSRFSPRILRSTGRHQDQHRRYARDTPISVGEVERILRMVDGVLLVVDAFDGPMPQTRFVLRKALALWPQADRRHQQDRPAWRRPAARARRSARPVHRARGRRGPARRTGRVCVSARGTSTLDLDQPLTNLEPLFDTIIREVPPPPRDESGPFQMLVSTIDHSPYLGRLAIGRVERGTVKVGQSIALLPMDHNAKVETARVTKLFGIEGSTVSRLRRRRRERSWRSPGSIRSRSA